MPTKRDLLENLKRDELLEIIDRYEIEIHDRRARAGIVDAVASSRKATASSFLEAFKRERLKELCRILNLDDSGREKQLFIDRLTGVAAKVSKQQPPKDISFMRETDKETSNDSGVANFSLEYADKIRAKPNKKSKRKSKNTEEENGTVRANAPTLTTVRTTSANPPLFSAAFLAARWEDEYRAFQETGSESRLLDKLNAWHRRDVLSETASEAAFIKHFFQEAWGYTLQGGSADGSYECYPQFAVSRAGQTGGKGKADLALGYFSHNPDEPKIPQVLCEFKDIKSGLDQPQNRKGNSRSPVRQAFDYLREAANDLSGNELVEPSWAIVTDMREFRLYNRVRGLTQCQSFSIDEESLLGKGEAASFNRFLFLKLFSREMLLSERGPSFLERLMKDQLLEEGAIEKDFYLEYKSYREFVYKTIVAANPNFSGTKGQLVRLTQRFLDRCLFVLFCEDMGVALDFPPDLLRDVLIRYSTDPFYNENDAMPWQRLKIMFTAMRDGGMFGDHKINRFNGGLFEPLPELEDLKIPATVFCAKNQAAGGMKTILSQPLTLLYLSAKYNFGIKNAAHERMIDFYALGRIFEQSITELEIMEAEVEGRESINLLTKRKRDGVYYTPEWVTAYIVEETIGARLGEIKEGIGLSPEDLPNDAHVLEYRAFLNDKRKTAKVAGRWLDGLKQYRTILNRFSIVDPACGSGAFLIQALEYLKKERQWIAEEQERISGERELWDWDEVVKEILANNIYGVDINPESVEIAKLALWMHTATRGKPLSSLDHNIQCGNSLVGSDFYRGRETELFTEEDKEKINVFDWREAFKYVFARGGFDCVIGNPPYVKLQHFRRVQNDVAEYLVAARNDDGSIKYESVQTGNFDLYLPFIEKGLELLNPDGKMGFIAPSVWLMNEYGKGLRNFIRKTHSLDRWIDFKDYQVFEEATTYTALQFYKHPDLGGNGFKVVFCPTGDISDVTWNNGEFVSFDELPDDAWALSARTGEGKLLQKLENRCISLGDIAEPFVGVQCNRDEVFILRRVGEGEYSPLDDSSRIISIEDEIMRELIGQEDARRYEEPVPSQYILYPYHISDPQAPLMTAQTLQTKYPKAWSYLVSYEALLRGREKGKFNDDRWYRYGRNKNPGPIGRPKLAIPETVSRLSATVDLSGSYLLNNVRVNGVPAIDENSAWFMLGILNCPVADFVFRRIAKPKRGGYFEANKQFIAPLPIPDANDVEKKTVGMLAKTLQELHTNRRDLVNKFERRLASAQCEEDKRTEKWLWAGLKTVAEWKKSKEVPDGVRGKDLAQWAKERAENQLQYHLDELDMMLKAGAKLSVDSSDDEISFLINGKSVLTIFDEPNSDFVAAQWRHIARTTNVTEKYSGKRLITALLKLRKTGNANLAIGVVKLDAEIQELDKQIEVAEKEINRIIYKLYDLSEEEIRLVENG